MHKGLRRAPFLLATIFDSSCYQGVRLVLLRDDGVRMNDEDLLPRLRRRAAR